MRIDKWLWAMRLYKTRSMAADACKSNRISVNGSVVKAAREVKQGDQVSVKKMPVIYSYKIIDFPKSRVGAALVPQFMRDITPDSEKDKLLQQVSVFVKRDRGMGRPTKKERREIDELMEDVSDNDFGWDDDDDLFTVDEQGYQNSKKIEKEEIDDFDFNF